jgi:hypothetical protein
MSLLSGFNITLPEVELLGQAARAAFSGGAIPDGWNVLTPQQLGVAPQYWDGLYFSNNGASAIVLQQQQGNDIIVSFRGTDSQQDFAYYPELLFGTYINRFQPLLSAIAAQPADTHFYFTGASLGGGAVNQMADIASSEYAGRFAAAQFVAFASPIIINANGILNVGFENDPIYKSLENYSDQPSSLDNLVLATAQYMAGNYDGRHLLDYYAHSSSALDVFARLEGSAFYDFMSPDSVVIFDAYSGAVTDVTPGRESSGAFYLGEAVADQIIGRAGIDFIEAFGGDDTLDGGGGADIMAGGAGNDVYVVDNAGDVVIENANEGNDTVYSTAHLRLTENVEYLVLQGSTDLQGYGNSLSNVLYGNSGSNILNGEAGIDAMFGGPGSDAYFVDNAGDVVIENANEGNDTVFSTAHLGLTENVEYLVLQGSADLQGYGNSLANVLYGNTGSNILNGGAGADMLTGGAGNDAFVFDVGQAAGDFVMDFAGNGALTGDWLLFVGYGAGATFTDIDTTHWEVNYNGGALHEIITFNNAASIDPGDFIFI